MKTSPVRDRNGDIYTRTPLENTVTTGIVLLFFFVLCPLYTFVLCLGIACFLLSFVFGWIYTLLGSFCIFLFFGMKIFVFGNDRDDVSLIIGTFILGIYALAIRYLSLG